MKNFILTVDLPADFMVPGAPKRDEIFLDADWMPNLPSRELFPHDCPICSQPAIILFSSVDCTNTNCGNNKGPK